MKTLTLSRAISNDKGTVGLLSHEGVPFLVTLELPYKDNQRDISCIPAGGYTCEWHNSFKFGECYRLLDVKDRNEILIHAGNETKDTHGCILVGRGFGIIQVPSVYLAESKLGLEKLYSLTNKEHFRLIIEEKP